MRVKLLLLFLCFSATVSAESITIKQKGGNETVLDLASHPVITFSGYDMVVTNDFTTISFPLGDIDCYVVDNASSGIRDLPDTPTYRDGHLILHGMKQGSAVQIYTIDGKMVNRMVADGSDYLDIHLGGLPKGTFIIRTPSTSIKVVNN